MEYRRLGRTGFEVSAIGLGTEYLIGRPRECVIGVIHRAIERGINYFDLFFAQPEFRDTMGLAFAGHRDRVFLAAHLGAAHQDGQYKRTRTLKTSEHFFHDFLTRYDTDHIDVLVLHNSDGQKDYDRLTKPNGLLEMAMRFRQEGKARFIGFSGHTVPTALQAVESEVIDVLMFPVNLAANAVPGKTDLLKACVTQNVGLAAMKPYAGGKLLNKEHAVRMSHYHTGGDASRLRKQSPITPVQCLSYVLSQAGVSTALPGCANQEQLAAALAYLDAPEEARDFSALLAEFEQYVEGECVYCNHCLPCPAKIDIGQINRLLDAAQRQLTAELRAAYAALPAKAPACTQCGACADRCPFGVPVIAKMEQAVALFGG
jgi:predicted aldo/keto reductase-like oxidoreductase